MNLKHFSLLILSIGVILFIGRNLLLLLNDGYAFLILCTCLMLFGIALITTALFCLIFPKAVKLSLTLKTTAISLCLSAVGAIGLTCALNWSAITAFSEVSKYPIEYPISVITGLVSLMVFIVLIGVYLKVRSAQPSAKGFIIDILTSIIYLPAFLFAMSFIYNLLN